MKYSNTPQRIPYLPAVFSKVAFNTTIKIEVSGGTKTRINYGYQTQRTDQKDLNLPSMMILCPPPDQKFWVDPLQLFLICI